jgi:thiol-activated cytolysin
MSPLRNILFLLLSTLGLALLPAWGSDEDAAGPDARTFNGVVIFPGNLLQGNSLGGATPNPIVVERAGGTITINLINGSEEVSQEVGQVRYSTVIQAMNDIIADNTGVVPAAFTYQSSQVQSREQMALSMGVNANSLTTEVNARLSINTDEAYSSFLVELNQRYYTMSFDMPTSLSALFHESVTPADLARYVSDANPATYISSVTYGRRFYLLIESNDSASDMQAAISASYDAALAGGSGHLEGRDVSTLSNVNVKVFALGGDHQLAIGALNGDSTAAA